MVVIGVPATMSLGPAMIPSSMACFIGKATFFESSIRIPIVLMGPGIDKNQTVNEMVELTDITSTILKWAGLPLPYWYDSEPLPGEGMPGQKGRERIFGLLSDGWMNFDGQYKLHKYLSGEVFLFDIAGDPDEQNKSGTIFPDFVKPSRDSDT